MQKQNKHIVLGNPLAKHPLANCPSLIQARSLAFIQAENIWMLLLHKYESYTNYFGDFQTYISKCSERG